MFTLRSFASKTETEHTLRYIKQTYTPFCNKIQLHAQLSADLF